MIEDLMRSGLSPEDMEATSSAMLHIPAGATAGYLIPYFTPAGRPVTDENNAIAMYRLRLKPAPFAKVPRYLQPTAEALARLGLPPVIPYVPPRTAEVEQCDEMYVAEGEKKAAAMVKHLKLPTIGIAGCQMWRDPVNNTKVHSWIIEILTTKKVKKLTIVPDADIFRYDISAAYGTFAQALRAQMPELTVKIINTGAKIDDWIVARDVSEDALREEFNAFPILDPEQLVQSTGSLVQEYSLAFSTNTKGVMKVYEHSSNVMRLLSGHPAFPKIWHNNDKARIMVGEEQAVPDYTEMMMANHFQHNFGMATVQSRLVQQCMVALSKQNARSPFLERIRSLEWDGVPRLDRWLTDLWGAEDDEFTRCVASRWLIGACARMTTPGTKVDWMMIIIGPQGTGKTSMPDIMFDGNSLTLYGETTDKDLHMLMHSSLCVGFDELDSFTRRESSHLKAMITRQEDSFRPPYGASIASYPRRFVLYGSGNRKEFLQSDETGYRRYGIIEIKNKLDFTGLKRERWNLWAEAYYRFQQQSDAFWEIPGATQQAEKFEAPNPLRDRVLSWLSTSTYGRAGANVKDGNLYFTMTQLMDGLDMGRELLNAGLTRSLSGILMSAGCERGNSRKEVAPGVVGRHYIYRIPDA